MRFRSLTRLVAGLAVLAAAGVSGCSGGADPARRGATEITPAAGSIRLLKEPQIVGDFTVTDLDGKAITAQALRGKVVLVNFWATWCPPCRAEIPDLVALQSKYKDHLVVIGISEDEEPVDVVRAFVADHKVNYFIAMATPELSKVFRGVAALPTTFVIDRDGRIVAKHIGQLDPDHTELETQYLAGLNDAVTVERVDDPARLRLENAAQATEIPGVDLTRLTPAKRTAAIKAMNAEDCTCGCSLTIAECRINDPACEVSLPLAKTLAEKIAAEP